MSDEQLRDVTAEFPPVVYLPCQEHVSDPQDAVIDMRTTRDGRTAVLTYSALDRLKSCCGDDQPWLVAPSAFLEQLRAIRPFDLVLLDVEIPEHERRRSTT